MVQKGKGEMGVKEGKEAVCLTDAPHPMTGYGLCTRKVW